MSLIKNKSKSNFLYLFFNRFFQNDFSKIIVDNIRTKKTINIFDVGSYIGEFSLNLKEVISNNANFYLFDPNPNLKIKNFNFFNIALDKNNSKKKFYFNEFLPHSGSSLKKITMDDLLWNFTRKLFLLSLNKKFKTLFVKTQTLDNFCKEKNISKIEVLKIDVEGGELDILNGSKKMLKNINIIYIEIFDKKSNFDKKFKTISDLLKKYNFELIKTQNILSVSIFSNIKAKDLLFVKKKLTS
jgi:FkbM family methyltransferase